MQSNSFKIIQESITHESQKVWKIHHTKQAKQYLTMLKEFKDYSSLYSTSTESINHSSDIPFTADTIPLTYLPVEEFAELFFNEESINTILLESLKERYYGRLFLAKEADWLTKLYE